MKRTTLSLAALLITASPCTAQAFDETVGYISEKLTAADAGQAMTTRGPCAVSFRAEYHVLVDITLLSKHSVRTYSEPNKLWTNMPDQWFLEVQCYNSDCIENPGATNAQLKNFRKVTMKVNGVDTDKLTKAWKHILDMCGAKGRRELF